MAARSTEWQPQTRVILWSHARSRSTAFELAIASDKNIHVIHEPFVMAYCVGEERHIQTTLRQEPPVPGYKYVDVQKMLEQPFPGKTAVFVKDNFSGGRGRYQYIPGGYVNTFLIRNPRASILSSFRITNNITMPTPSVDTDAAISWCINTSGYESLFNLYRYVTEELEAPPIVVDSADLANSPRETLEKYCKATGLPFCESFVKWEPGNIDHFPLSMKTSEYTKLFFKKAIDSSCFHPSSDTDIDLTDLPEKLVQFADDCMPMYERMASKKL